MYNLIKGSKINYNSDDPFVVETKLEDKSAELTDEQEAVVVNEINRRLKEIEDNAGVIADEIIKRAQDEADQMLEKVRFESARIFDAKQKEGFEKGFSEAAERYKAVLDNAQRLIEDEKRRIDEEIDSLFDDVLDLSAEMAHKITAIEFDRNDKAILAALSRLMEDYKNEKKVIIELSVNNFEKLKDTELAKKYTFQENKLLGDKDALVELNNGTIDISMDKQLENLTETMKEQ